MGIYYDPTARGLHVPTVPNDEAPAGVNKLPFCIKKDEFIGRELLHKDIFSIFARFLED